MHKCIDTGGLGMAILVTGGAGYIGSHTCVELSLIHISIRIPPPQICANR